MQATGDPRDHSSAIFQNGLAGRGPRFRQSVTDASHETQRSTPRNSNRLDQTIDPLSLQTPGVMSVSELMDWAQVGKNSVSRLITDFKIPELTGKSTFQRFGVVQVFRQILGLVPETPNEFTLLLKPLQPAFWVAAVTGTSTSTLSEGARVGGLRLPPPTQLYKTSALQAAPRGRRWLPCQIEAHIAGEKIPFSPSRKRRGSAPKLEASNVFAAICTGNGGVSR